MEKPGQFRAEINTHHLPRLIGFMSGGRVDMEQYSRDAALVGIGGTTKQIDKGAHETMRALTRVPGQIEGPRTALPSNSHGPMSQQGGMDSTLRAATDNPGPMGSEEA